MKDHSFSSMWKKIFKKKLEEIPPKADLNLPDQPLPESFFQEIVQDATAWEEICHKWLATNLQRISELEKSLELVRAEYKAPQKPFLKKASKDSRALENQDALDRAEAHAQKLKEEIAHIRSVMSLFLECQGEASDQLKNSQQNLENQLAQKQEVLLGFEKEVGELKNRFEENTARLNEALARTSEELETTKKNRDEWIAKSRQQETLLRKNEEEILEQGVLIENLMAAKTVLETSCTELSKNRDEFETGRPVLESQLRDFSEKNKTLQAELKQLDTALAEATRLRNESAAQAQDKAAILEKNAATIAELERKVKKLETAQFSLEGLCIELTQKCSALEIAKTELEKEFRAKEFEKKKMFDLLAAAEKVRDEWITKSQDQAEAIQNLETRNAELYTAKQELESSRALEQAELLRRHEADAVAFNTRIHELEASKANLENGLAQAAQKIQKLESLKTDLEDDLQKQNERGRAFEEEISKIRMDLNLAEKVRDEWIATGQKQAEALKNYEETLAVFRADIHELKSAKTKAENELTQAAQKVQELESWKSNLEKEIQARVEENAHLERELGQAREAVTATEKTRDEWIAKGQEQSAEIQKHGQVFSELNGQIEHFKKLQAETEQARNNLAHHCGELEALKGRLESELGVRAEKAALLEQEINKLRDLLAATEKSRDEGIQKQREQEESLKKYEELKERHQQLMISGEETNRVLRDAEQKIAELQNWNQQTQIASQAEIAKTQEMMRLSEERFKEASAALEKLGWEKNLFEEKCRNLEQEKSEAAKLSQQKEKEYQTLFAAAEKELEAAQATLDLQRKELQRLAEEQKGAEATKRSLIEAHQKLEEQFEKDKTEWCDILAQVAKTKESLEQELQKPVPETSQSVEALELKALKEKHIQMEQELVAGREMFRKRLCSLFEEVEFWKKKALFGKGTSQNESRDEASLAEMIPHNLETSSETVKKQGPSSAPLGTADNKTGNDIIASLRYLQELIEKGDTSESNPES